MNNRNNTHYDPHDPFVLVNLLSKKVQHWQQIKEIVCSTANEIFPLKIHFNQQKKKRADIL